MEILLLFLRTKTLFPSNFFKVFCLLWDVCFSSNLLLFLFQGHASDQKFRCETAFLSRQVWAICGLEDKRLCLLRRNPESESSQTVVSSRRKTQLPPPVKQTPKEWATFGWSFLTVSSARGFCNAQSLINKKEYLFVLAELWVDYFTWKSASQPTQ